MAPVAFTRLLTTPIHARIVTYNAFPEVPEPQSASTSPGKPSAKRRGAIRRYPALVGYRTPMLEYVSLIAYVRGLISSLVS